MNIKVNFISNLTKTNSANNIVFVKDNKFKNKILNPIIKSVINNELFKDDLFVQKEFNNSNYIFVNFKNMSTSSDCENIGSKLYDYLKKNKLENSCIETNKIDLSQDQLERIVHGAKLKSYNFNIYKSDKNKNKNITLNIIGKKINKSNKLRKNLDALLDGVFFTRDLVSEPGNILHPDEYANRLNKLKKLGLKVTIYDQRKLKKMGFNALLGV